MMEYKYFDSLLEAVFVLNHEKKIVYCNEAASLMADVSARKLVRGATVFDQVFQFDQPIEALAQLAKITDASPYQETAFTTAEGKSGRVQLTIQGVPVADQTTHYIVFFRDVTLEETLQRKYRSELEKTQAYARNLEKMVDERTAEIKKLNQLLKALLDSLGQGFFAFDPQGQCFQVFSRACEKIVECAPPGKMIWDVLKLKPKEHEGFKRWLTAVYAEMLPFEDLAPLGPQRFSHSGNKQVKLEYYPLRNSEGKMEGVVVVATDITELVQAQHQAETEAANVQMILSLLKNRGQTHRFIQEAQNLLEDLHHDLEKGVNCDPDSLFRVLHTLKGGAATYSIKTVTETCHASETLLQEWKSFSETTQSQESWNALATKAKQIPEQFQNFLKDNEPIIGKAERFKERWLEFPISDFYDFSDKHLQYHHEIRRHFNYTFLYEPLKSYFSSYDEVVQGVAETTGKQVDRIFVDNSDLKIWPEPYNNLLSTFVHAFRNAVDHGIELPEKRQEVGKPIAGQIHVSFLRNKKGLLFTIRDDGGGIDPAEIRAKLSAKGLDVAGESDKQVIQHIFDSSFSTKEQVTEVSGRGVGMDAIRYAAEALGGKVWVRSVVGKGTELFVHVPWIESKMSLAMTAA